MLKAIEKCMCLLIDCLIKHAPCSNIKIIPHIWLHSIDKVKNHTEKFDWENGENIVKPRKWIFDFVMNTFSYSIKYRNFSFPFMFDLHLRAYKEFN